MDNGEDYLSVMKENLTALKTTDTAGKEVQPETSENRKPWLTDISKTVRWLREH